MDSQDNSQDNSKDNTNFFTRGVDERKIKEYERLIKEMEEAFKTGDMKKQKELSDKAWKTILNRT